MRRTHGAEALPWLPHEEWESLVEKSNPSCGYTGMATTVKHFNSKHKWTDKNSPYSGSHSPLLLTLSSVADNGELSMYGRGWSSPSNKVQVNFTYFYGN